MKRTSSNRGYPLSALFLLVTASGVVLAMVAPVLRGPCEAGTEELLGAAIAGSLTLGLLGLFLGLFHYSRWRGVLWGVLLGGVLGLLIGPMAFISPTSLPFVLLNSLGGAVVILGIAAVSRLTFAPPASAPGSPFQETENGVAAERRQLSPDDHCAGQQTL